MNFIEKYPSTWEELQDYVALLLNQAGYHATSPCTIGTVRGQVEVDVLVESPDVLVKKIICECKFWKTPVPKEKVHAFRTVVHDSGATLGLLISRAGFQSGAIEAAKFSNVQLRTWEEFTDLIADKWTIETLKRIKKKCDRVAESCIGGFDYVQMLMLRQRNAAGSRRRSHCLYLSGVLVGKRCVPEKPR